MAERSGTFASEDFDPSASPPLDEGEMDKLGGAVRCGARERGGRDRAAFCEWVGCKVRSLIP